MKRHALLAAATAALLITAGCLGGTAPASDATRNDRTTTGDGPNTSPNSSASPSRGTLTPLPDRTVEFPDGPKDRPQRPATLTADAVGEFALLHEYRYAYNLLWTNEYSEVSLECELDDAANTSVGWRVTVTCTGSSNTGGEPTDTGTSTVVHADWFTQTYVYSIDENSLLRDRERFE